MSIELKGVNFDFPGESIFSDLTLSLSAPGFIGLVGVNGSGKSTLFNLLLGRLQPSDGSITLSGHPPGKSLVGSAFQEIDFPENATVKEVLSFVTAHYRYALPLDALLERFYLTTISSKRCSSLSGGMKRRLALACAFAGNPKIVLLDEPSTGLDKETRGALWETIARYREEHNALVLMITHHPQEISPYVDQFLLLKKQKAPRLVAPEEFSSLTQLKRLSFRSSHPLTFPLAREVRCDGDHYEVVGADGDALVRRLAEQTVDFSQLGMESMPVEQLLERYL